MFGFLKKLRDKIEKEPKKQLSQSELASFNNVREKIEAFFITEADGGSTEESMHTIENLALLSGKDNSSLNNAIFPIKSKKISQLEKEGSFIPQCTKNVFLKALTPNANGVIGALAGIGLRLSGSDGKIRGKFELEKSNLSVCELLRLNFVEAVVDENFKSLLLDERVNLIGALKPVFLDFKATLLVKKESDGGFRNLSVKELRDF